MPSVCTKDILNFWHQIEFFSACDLDSQCDKYSILKKSQLERRASQVLPWVNPEYLSAMGGLKNKTYCYDLYLLPFDKSQIDKEADLFSKLDVPDKQMFEYNEIVDRQGRTCFAVVTVDSQGGVNLKSLSVSTLPWALGKLKQNKIAELNAQTFENEKQRLMDLLGQIQESINAGEYFSEEGSSKGVFTSSALKTLTQSLTSWSHFIPENDDSIVAIGLREKKQPSKKTREVAITKANQQQESCNTDDTVEILNSFFIEDLERVNVDIENSPHKNIDKYLLGSPDDKKDLYDEENGQWILDQLTPLNLKKGRWPSPPEQHMSVRQQLSVQLALDPKNDFFSVNGPPGTGKTTLLKDLVADLVTQRARKLASFSNVIDTFKESVSIQIGGESHKIYPIDDALAGYEILVASSNNAAVENISSDIPALKEIAHQYRAECSYVRQVSDKCRSSYKKSSGEFLLEPNNQSWGLISVALGKSSNRYRFSTKFFSSFDSAELREARLEANKILNIWEWCKNRNKNKVPSFKQAKLKFLESESALDAEILRLEELRELHSILSSNTEKTYCKGAEVELQKVDSEIANITIHISQLHQLEAECDAEIDKQNKRLLAHKKLRPSFIERIFNLGNCSWYLTEEKKLQNQYTKICASLQKYSLDRAKKEVTLEELADSKKVLEREFISKKKEYRLKASQFAELLEQYQVDMPALYTPETLILESSQLRAPFATTKLNDLRVKYFIAALQLHESWLAESYGVGRLSGSFRVIQYLLANRVPAKKDQSLAIWKNLFMCVPVISSTFASISRQFKSIGRESFGWLFVDEAGQALPQAAVGAIWRVKKAVFVGDPKQIEPVCSTPPKLMLALADRFKNYDLSGWIPSQTSVQVLADTGNKYGANVGPYSKDTSWVGCPLRVHRRCLNPMFQISNLIAYQGTMINARHPKEVPPSIWIDSRGEATDRQYVPEHGEALIKWLLSEYLSSGKIPEVYVLSPFRAVVRKIEVLIGRATFWQDILPAWAKAPERSELKRNIKVGTVHTFQGKQADTVVLVLGVDASSPGSASWASTKPNILNVAVSRAKNRLIVIGDKTIWARQPYFSVMANELCDANPARSQSLL